MSAPDIRADLNEFPNSPARLPRLPSHREGRYIVDERWGEQLKVYDAPLPSAAGRGGTGSKSRGLGERGNNPIARGEEETSAALAPRELHLTLGPPGKRTDECD